MALTELQASSLAIFWQSLFLGVHSVLIVVVLWIWSSPKLGRRVHFMLYTALMVMYFLAVAHSTIVLTRIMHPELNKLVHLQQTLTTLATFQFMFGDYVIMWRTWTVWNYRYWVIALPFCISCTAFAFAFATIKRGQQFSLEPPALLVGSFLICTGLIIGRILYVNYVSHGENLSAFKRSPYKGIVILLFETGALYTAVQITSLILFKHQSPILPVFLDLMVPLMGLLPSTIVVLVALEALPSSSTNPTSFNVSVETGMRFEDHVVHSTQGETATTATSSIRYIGDDSSDKARLEKEKAYGPNNVHFNTAV